MITIYILFHQMKRLQLYKLSPNSKQALQILLVREIQQDIQNTQSKYSSIHMFPVSTKSNYRSIKQIQVKNVQEVQYNKKTPQHRSQKLSLLKNSNKLTNSMILDNHNLPPIDLGKRNRFYKKYYMDNLIKALTLNQMTYLSKLAREHFSENIKAMQITKFMKIQNFKKLQLPKLVTHRKTILLDLDQTLIHSSQLISHPNLKLNIPLENGTSIIAGINIRPYCQEFLKQLSQIAQVIIFTASNAIYADPILNHLDQKKHISHRLYRQHCTLGNGFYIKDLRTINRNLEDMVLVDNSFYSYCLQLQNGIPILPFYDNHKDKQLVNLLEYLKQLIKQKDVRQMNKKFFLMNRYRESDIKNIIINSN